MQEKLLRAIQRLGSTEKKKANVRIITATARDLSVEVLEGRFHKDLFRRLRSVEIRVPGLDERPEDIPALVHYFLKKHSQGKRKAIAGRYPTNADRPVAARLVRQCSRTRECDLSRCDDSPCGVDRRR